MNPELRHIMSAIIGMWRSGANVYEIAGVTGFGYNFIKTVIENYKKHIETDWQGADDLHIKNNPD